MMGAPSGWPATTAAVCHIAIDAIEAKLWVPVGDGQVRSLRCAPGNLFTPRELCIPGFNRCEE